MRILGQTLSRSSGSFTLLQITGTSTSALTVTGGILAGSIKSSSTSAVQLQLVRENTANDAGVGMDFVRWNASSAAFTAAQIFGVTRANTAGAETGSLTFWTRLAGTTAQKAEITGAGALLLSATTGVTLNVSSTDAAAITCAGGLALGAAKAITIGAAQVVGAQGAAVADASGGSTVDAEARTALNTLLARLRVHGLIAT